MYKINQIDRIESYVAIRRFLRELFAKTLGKGSIGTPSAKVNIILSITLMKTETLFYELSRISLSQMSFVVDGSPNPKSSYNIFHPATKHPILSIIYPPSPID